MEKRKIHDFAEKWLAKYNNPETPDAELEERFADDCIALGFGMDCGESFESMYGLDAFQNADELRKTADRVRDVHILGAAIFSKWRYSTHWSCSPLDREWFVIALSRLAELTE